jgi:isoamylase
LQIVQERGEAELQQSYPLGATVLPDGVNFSVFSHGASGVELLLFDREDDARPCRVISIDPATNRTYHYWHVFVSAVRSGQIYGYRAHGPWDPANGMRFDPSNLLLDPYSRSAVVPKSYHRNAIRNNFATTADAMKSVIVDTHTYDGGHTQENRGSLRRVVAGGY